MVVEERNAGRCDVGGLGLDRLDVRGDISEGIVGSVEGGVEAGRSSGASG